MNTHVKPRALHIIDHPGLGGAQRMVQALVNSIGAFEHFAYVMRDDRTKCLSESPRVEIYPSTSPLSLATLRGLVNTIKRTRPKVLHFHLLKAQFTSTIIPYLLREPLSIFVHEHGEILGPPTPLKKLVFGLLSKSTARIVAPSNAVAQKLTDQLLINPERIRTILNPCLLDHIKENQLPSTDTLFNGATVTIGFIGRLVEQKGLDILLEALAKLPPRFQLTVVGEGPDRLKYERLSTRLGIKSQVRFIGLAQDIRSELNNFEILVVPSRWEPFGLVALEGFALGIPVIASNVDGLAEICSRQEALLVSPNDPDALCTAIESTVNNPDTVSLRQRRGLATVKDHSLETYTRTLEGFYLE